MLTYKNEALYDFPHGRVSIGTHQVMATENRKDRRPINALHHKTKENQPTPIRATKLKMTGLGWCDHFSPGYMPVIYGSIASE